MNCEQVNGLLDQWMDGELDEEQRLAMEAHGRECPQCAAAIRSTRQLKALFEQMEPEVDVPLQAQAGWRGAVRAEARAARGRRLRRWIASAAAAIVVLVGVGLALNMKGAPKQDTASSLASVESAASEAAEALEAADEAPALPSNGMPVALESAGKTAGEAEYEEAAEYEAAQSAVVETDGPVADAEEGESDMIAAEDAGVVALSTNAARRGPAWELSIRVEDVDKACNTLRDLAEEYEGNADVQALADGGANVYVEIESGNVGDFISAVLPLDLSGKVHDLPGFGNEGMVQLLLTVNH